MYIIRRALILLSDLLRLSMEEGALLFKDTGLAQLVEHWSPKPGVGSSSLSTRANIVVYEVF